MVLLVSSTTDATKLFFKLKFIPAVSVFLTLASLCFLFEFSEADHVCHMSCSCTRCVRQGYKYIAIVLMNRSSYLHMGWVPIKKKKDMLSPAPGKKQVSKWCNIFHDAKSWFYGRLLFNLQPNATFLDDVSIYKCKSEKDVGLRSSFMLNIILVVANSGLKVWTKSWQQNFGDIHGYFFSLSLYRILTCKTFDYKIVPSWRSLAFVDIQ